MTSVLPVVVDVVSPASSSRGRHRAPSRTGRRVARVAATVGAGAPLAALGLGVAPLAHADTNWDAVAACESGGNWSTDTGNGYSGGLQFSDSTWHAFGGSGSPSDASRSAQIAVAEKVKASQGMGAWPVCSKKAGQTSSSPNSSSGDDSSSTKAKSKSKTGSTTTKAAGATTKKKKAAKSTTADTSGSGDTYTVRAGDTLGSIATAQDVDGGWQALRDANQKVVTDPNMIFPGQKLSLS